MRLPVCKLWIIATYFLSCSVFNIWRIINLIVAADRGWLSLLTKSLGWTPKFRFAKPGLKSLETSCYRMVCNIFRYIEPWLTSVRDGRRTDGQTFWWQMPRFSKLHDKNLAMFHNHWSIINCGLLWVMVVCRWDEFVRFDAHCHSSGCRCTCRRRCNCCCRRCCCLHTSSSQVGKKLNDYDYPFLINHYFAAHTYRVGENTNSWYMNVFLCYHIQLRSYKCFKKSHAFWLSPYT